MTKAKRLPNGNLLVPARAETEDGNKIGDGVKEVSPGTPEYEAWLPYVERVDRRESTSLRRER